MTYILIAVVGIIWYQVFVRVKSNFTEEETPEGPLNAVTSSPLSFHRDAFKLDAAYRDPFSTTSFAAPTASLVPNSGIPEPPKPVIPKPEIQWPKIVYYGFIRNVESKVPRALVSVDGELFKLKSGETVLDNLQVTHTWRDSIRFQYRKKVRTFRKK